MRKPLGDRAEAEAASARDAVEFDGPALGAAMSMDLSRGAPAKGRDANGRYRPFRNHDLFPDP